MAIIMDDVGRADVVSAYFCLLIFHWQPRVRTALTSVVAMLRRVISRHLSSHWWLEGQRSVREDV